MYVWARTRAAIPTLKRGMYKTHAKSLCINMWRKIACKNNASHLCNNFVFVRDNYARGLCSVTNTSVPLLVTSYVFLQCPKSAYS